jgi:hypothetical protein
LEFRMPIGFVIRHSNFVNQFLVAIARQGFQNTVCVRLFQHTCAA